MSALFDFSSLIVVNLLFICTCTFVKHYFPSLLDRKRTGLSGIPWKAARIGERKSEFVAAFCVFMAISTMIS